MKKLPVLLAVPLLLAGHGAVAQGSLGIAALQGAGAHRQEVGKRLTFVCPATDGATATVYGTDVYTDDSAVCAAAVHAGALRVGEAGAVSIVIGSGAEAFVGSERHGVRTRSYGAWPYSYSFVRDGRPATVSWATVWSQVPAEFTGPITVVCPAAETGDGVIWGTDVYSRDSALCVAGVHAGAITAGRGGVIAIRRAPAPREYVATERFGVASRRWSGTPDAFTVAPAAGSAESRAASDRGAAPAAAGGAAGASAAAGAAATSEVSSGHIGAAPDAAAGAAAIGAVATSGAADGGAGVARAGAAGTAAGAASATATSGAAELRAVSHGGASAAAAAGGGGSSLGNAGGGAGAVAGAAGSGAGAGTVGAATSPSPGGAAAAAAGGADGAAATAGPEAGSASAGGAAPAGGAAAGTAGASASPGESSAGSTLATHPTTPACVGTAAACSGTAVGRSPRR